MAASRPKIEKGRFDLREIKKLIEMIERSPITEFELVGKDLKIRISKNGFDHSVARMMTLPATAAPVSTPVAPPIAAPSEGPAPPRAETVERKLIDVRCPMVGTFYRALAPDADPYVRVGETVELGKVLCIVEAMKLMNEIESEVRGRVVEICVENAQPVEYGQTLFRIDTSAA